MSEKVYGLTAGVIASMVTGSSHTVNALGSFERVVLVDTRRLLDTSQIGLNATAELESGQTSNDTGGFS